MLAGHPAAVITDLLSDVTRILSSIEQGDPHAAGELLPLVYEELRQLAAHKMAQEAAGQTLQPTALVHEAYLRLVGEGRGPHFDGRGHFFAAAALGIAPRTAHRYWAFARAWLYDALCQD